MGPFAKLLLTIAKIQAKFPTDKSPIRTALVTARSAPTHERVIKTFNVWGVRVDEAFFLGGTDKYEILETLGGGAFGIVYLGELWSTLVAVKKIDIDNNENYKLIINELTLLNEISHPNLINLLHFFAQFIRLTIHE